MKEVYSGSFQKKLVQKNSSLQPFILDDYSIVITKKSINRFFGHSGQSDWINEFMHGFSRYGIGATGLLEKLSNPIWFKATKTDGYPTVEEAYTTKTLLEACHFILFAKKEGFLSVIELKFATIAESIINWDKTFPFDSQIAEITGFNLLKWKAQQRIVAELSKKQKEAAHIWTAALPAEFWDILMDELQTDWKQIIRKPLQPAKFCQDWLFGRLPEATIEEMRNKKPKRPYRNKKSPPKPQIQGLDAYVKLFAGLYAVSEQNLGILEQLLGKTHPIKRTAQFEPESEPAEPTGFFKQLSETLVSKP